MVDATSGHYLHSDFGRCDRQSSCRYFKYPGSTINQVSPLTCHKPRTQPDFHNDSQFESSLKNWNNDNFSIYLKSQFDNYLVDLSMADYFVGCSSVRWPKSSVFWQIDENRNVRAGKVIHYNPITGCRTKEPYPKISWMHKELLLDKFNLEQCLFGLHLLVMKYSSFKSELPIKIVESEKTAIIMSINEPDYLWMATGSKSNFNERMLAPLKKYVIHAYPDKSEYLHWSKRASELNSKGYHIKVSNILENSGLPDGSDLVDFYNSIY